MPTKTFWAAALLGLFGRRLAVFRPRRVSAAARIRHLTEQ
jgi:hypothetical protein